MAGGRCSCAPSRSFRWHSWCVLGAASMLALVWLPRSPLEDMALFGLMAMFSYGATAVLQAFVMELFPTHLRATGAALSASAGLCLGFAIFPVLTAWIIEAI